MVRGATVVIVIVMFVGAGTWLGATAIRANRRQSVERATQSEAQLADNGGSPAPSTDALPGAAPRAAQQGEATSSADAPLAPVLPSGETSLRDGVTASRSDNTVTLSFDTPLARTRIPEKFEEFVRATLPAIYGPSVESVLAKVPRGGIARQGNLISELPFRGVQIAVGDAWTIRLFPETRPGQDGPLVVRYRVSVVAKGK